jgi:hypothetical protein
VTITEPSSPSRATLNRLYALSGNRCAFPRCAAQIIAGVPTLGEVCHIRAASPGGPRYDSSQTAAQRHGYDNLILLCANHHTVIDADVEAYTVTRLLKMKADHEQNATALPEEEAAAGAQMLLSVNQSGGIAANNIHTINIHPPASVRMPRALPVSAGMKFFAAGDVLGDRGETFNAERFVYLRLIPASNHPPIGMPRLLEVFKQAKLIPMSDRWSGTATRNRHGAIFYNTGSTQDIPAFTQGFLSGELWGMNGRLFQFQRHPVLPNEPEQETHIVPAVAMEKLYVATLPNFVRVAATEFNLPLPYTIEFGIKGIEGAYISFPRYPAGHIVGPIYEEAFRRTYPLHEPTPEAITDLIRRFATDFYELVGAKRADMFEESFIVGHELPPR